MSKSAPPPPPPPQPEPEPAPTHTHLTKEPVPLPEPAIKFDNIKDEDYGDNVLDNTKPADIDNEAIAQLVTQFLEGPDKNKPGPKFANEAAQKLVNSSPYWLDKGIKPAGSVKDPEEAKMWLDGYYLEAQKVLYQVTTAGWHYFTSISGDSRKALAEAQDVMSRFVRSTSMQAKQFDSSVMPEEMQRQLNYVSFEGMSALSEKDHQAYTSAQDHVNQQVSETVTCEKDIKPCGLKKSDISSMFTADKDAEHLKYLWTAWIKNVARLRPQYKKLLDLSNTAAKLNGFADGGAMWRSAFDLSNKNTPPKFDLKVKAQEIYDKVKPFYQQLHAYMRRQIAGIYKNPAGLTKDRPIPAHLFGSTEGGEWANHYDQTKPNFEDDPVSSEILEAMQAQNYTSKTMFIKAYRYMKSVGFPSLPKTFWTSSVFQRVWSKDMLCDPAAAFDMRDGKDFRVKACAQIGEPDFKLAHSLLAQVYYQYLYRTQAGAFRESASPSINEAIAAVFSHLASNPNYLYSQQLLSHEHLEIKESTIVNRLYKEALDNIAKIPFAVTADTWRYDILEGKTDDDKWNEEWWKLRETLEGVKAPEEKIMPAQTDAFMHTQINQVHSPAIRNLISYVAQFQILKSLCPPDTELAEGCILSEDTTFKLRETMAKGSSIDWLMALEMLTGKAELDAQPLLDYFKPLITWLENANEINQVYVGWDGEGARFQADEIPEIQSDGKVSSGILSEDKVAFPGGACTNGEDCLLDSHCDGKVCVCNEGLFTLKFDNTVSCVASNPMTSGFIGGDGDFIGVNLVPSETTTTEAPKVTTRVTTSRPITRSATTAFGFGFLIALLCALF
ncbi:unnamed protein product, partial [Mesorhabditis spiculigera]